jgi:hypothetical protein
MKLRKAAFGSLWGGVHREFPNGSLAMDCLPITRWYLLDRSLRLSCPLTSFGPSVMNFEAALSVMLKPSESVRITDSTLVPIRLARLVITAPKPQECDSKSDRYAISASSTSLPGSRAYLRRKLQAAGSA